MADNLVHSYVGTHTVTQEEQVSEETAEGSSERRHSGSSGMTRRRKQATPRRTVASASQSSSVEATSEQPQEGDEEDTEQMPPAPPDPRECLLALPGIAATRIPKEDSINRLKQFLQNNQPCDPPRVSWNEKLSCVNSWTENCFSYLYRIYSIKCRPCINAALE